MTSVGAFLYLAVSPDRPGWQESTSGRCKNKTGYLESFFLLMGGNCRPLTHTPTQLHSTWLLYLLETLKEIWFKGDSLWYCSGAFLQQFTWGNIAEHRILHRQGFSPAANIPCHVPKFENFPAVFRFYKHVPLLTTVTSSFHRHKMSSRSDILESNFHRCNTNELCSTVCDRIDLSSSYMQDLLLFIPYLNQWEGKLTSQ